MTDTTKTNIFQQTWRDFSDDNCSRIAAALSYYTVFALPPLLVLVIMICGFFLDPADVEGRVAGEIRNVIGPSGAEQVQTMIHAADRQSGGLLASIISLVVLLVGASGAVLALQGALNDVWEVKPDPEKGGIMNFITKRLLSFGMVLMIAFLLLVSLVLTTMITALSQSILPGDLSPTALQVINSLISFVAITALFAAMFNVLPDADVAWKDVWVGAGLTAVMFVIGKFALGLYFSQSDVGSAYGAAGSLVLILVWIYYSAMILLMGAEFTQAWAKRYGTGIVPSEGAVRVIEKTEHVRPQKGQVTAS